MQHHIRTKTGENAPCDTSEVCSLFGYYTGWLIQFNCLKGIQWRICVSSVNLSQIVLCLLYTDYISIPCDSLCYMLNHIPYCNACYYRSSCSPILHALGNQHCKPLSNCVIWVYNVFTGCFGVLEIKQNRFAKAPRTHMI